MSYTKVTDEDRLNKGVTGLPDVPQLSTEEMQEKFDELGNMGIDALNNLVDELEASTGADSLGATVPTGIIAEPNVGSILAALNTMYNSLEEDSHTHVNKATIDEISSVVKTGYDRLVAIFQNINSVNNGVMDDSDSIPTGHAIVNYVSRLGGGDMMKAVYDQNDSGTVDNADSVQGHTVTESASAITNPTAETGAQLPTASAANSVYTALNDDINSRIPKANIVTFQSISDDTVPSSSLLNNVNNTLTSAISALSAVAFKMVDSFTVKSPSSSSIETHVVNFEPGYVYVFVSTTHKMVNGNPGAISGTIGVTLRYMNRYMNNNAWVETIVGKDIIAPSNFSLTSDAANRRVTAKATTAYEASCTVLALPVG